MEHDTAGQPDDFTVLAGFVEGADQEDPGPVEQAADDTYRPAVDGPRQSTSTTGALERLTEDFSGLQATVEKGFALLDRQSDLVDRLHGENERLRRGEFDRMLDPVIRDLVALADSCLRNADAWLARPDTTPADLHRVLGDVASDISLVLERQGVETFAPAPGDPFDRRQQRATRTEPTPQPELNGRIARTLRPGYRSGNRTIRFAEVVVLSYEPETSTSPTGSAPEPSAGTGSAGQSA